MRDDQGNESSSSAERHFCGMCGSHLWLFSPEWPELVHPLAAAVDSDLPPPPEHVDIMLRYKASWADVPQAEQAEGPGFKHFQEYPVESIEEWHKRHGMLTQD
uniref:CENP-V/GFA domain-containing protein n=1 Tax=Tetradesmus obliquus TaxID=3088 RepID=A0A383VJX5_TETOB|eukprot:jgi/Sobl393_1/15408/SZX65828.1